MLINGKRIGENEPIFLIAEAGINHNGQINLAKEMIDKAVEAKVDCIKFQTFFTEEVFMKSTKKADYQKISENDNQTFDEMVKKLEFSKEEFKELKNYCQEKGIIFLSTPYDNKSVEILEDLKVSAYKVGSGDLTNFPMLKFICSKKKPILLSTGMANLHEVKQAVDFIKSNKIEDLIIFQCTTNYPSDFEEINLNVIDTYKKEFPNCLIGFSDHSIGFEASIGAATKGVVVIEKHFTLNKEMEGPDHKTSLDPIELSEWVKRIRNLEKALGIYDKIPSEAEKKIAKISRKSLVSLKNLKKEHVLQEGDIGIKRPGIGISPIFYEKVIGKKLNRDIPKDSIISWEDLR